MTIVIVAILLVLLAVGVALWAAMAVIREVDETDD